VSSIVLGEIVVPSGKKYSAVLLSTVTLRFLK
jgi:hypothetical protein